MKLEKWTLGLAAAGLVTLSPGLLAQTPAPQLASLQTALTATTISGYVDTSAVWNPGTGNANPAPFAFNSGKQDGFNINVLDVKLAKDLDESSWSAGYTLEVNYGPDAVGIDGRANKVTGGNFANNIGYPIRQAYIVMRTPIGNGLDWKLGRFDNLLGYESSDSYKDPNWTRSYGYTFEPTEHTGLLASYKFCDVLNAQAGVANTVTTLGVNSRTPTGIESKKAFVSLLTLTAPDSMGSFKGSSLYAGWDYGSGAGSIAPSAAMPAGQSAHSKSEIYVGTTINTPVTGLSFGASWDAIFHNDVGGVDESYFQAIAGYVSFKATDKLSLNARVEYADGLGLGAVADAANGTSSFTTEAGTTTIHNPLNKVLAVTGTVQYDLWANVISRLEIRWDHACNGANAFGGVGTPGTSADGTMPVGYPDKKNDVMIAANVIYKF